MDITKKLKNVEKKISSLKENFTQEEAFLVSSNSKLLKEYVIALSKNPSAWEKHDVIIDGSITIDYLNGSELYNVLENIIFSYYKRNNILNFSYIDEITRAFSCPTNIRDDFARKFSDVILGGKYEFFNSCDTYAMAILLKHDRKDLVANIKSLDGSINENVLEKYYQYCGENNIPALINLNNIRIPILMKNLDCLGIDSLFRLIIDKKVYSKADLQLEVHNKLIEKISHFSGELSLNIPIDALCYYMPFDRALALYGALYSKGYILYADVLLQNKHISKEDLTIRVRNYCLSKKELDEEILKRYVAFLNDKEILIHLSKTNQIQFLFSKEVYPEYSKNKKEILSNLLNNKGLKKLLENCSFNEICNNQDLALELARRGKLSSLRLNCEDMSISKKEIAFLERLIKQYNIKLLVDTTTHTSERNPFILKILLKYNYISEFISLAKYTQEVGSLICTYADKIMACIDDDLISLNEFTKKFILFIMTDEAFLSFYANNDIYLTELIISAAKELNNKEWLSSRKIYTIPFYQLFKGKLAKLYKIDEENLDIVYNITGPDIIDYLGNENIHNLMNLDKKDLLKILSLFPRQRITMDDLTEIYQSIREYTFPKDNPENARIFYNILEAIKNNDEETLDSLTTEIDSCFDEKLFNELNSLYQLSELGFSATNHTKMLELIILKIQTSPNSEKYKTILHTICNYYINCKRKEFADINNMGEQLQLQFEYDDRNVKEELAQFIAKNINDRDLLEKLIKSLKNNGFTTEEIKNLFYVLRGNKEKSSVSPKILKKFDKFNQSIFDFISEMGLLYQYKKALENQGKIKKNYTLTGMRYLDISKILSNLKIDNVLKVINGNESTFETLKMLFKAKKIHLLPININNLFRTSNTSFSYTEEIIAAIINHYPEIYSYEQKKAIKRKRNQLISITAKINKLTLEGKLGKANKLIKQKDRIESELKGEVSIVLTPVQALLGADAYKAVSSVYSLILTPEDARLIKDNPGPARAEYKNKNNQRLKEAVEYTKLLFQRKELSIPTLNEVLHVNENTDIRVLVGNFTDSANLTHGERAGTCLRIGGQGENLFHNAITNKDCCHIKFEDSITGEYLSGITCFRIGNTLLFNEAREILNKDILSEADFIKAIRTIARTLIANSKKSSYPIENVIISKTGLLRNYPKSVDLNIGENGETINRIYNNINPSNCIVLATSSPNEFAPLNFNNEGLPSYLPARRIPKQVTEKEKLMSYVNRIESVKDLLNGVDYRLLKGKVIKQDLYYALVNDEWYIYIDTEGNIFSNCIEADERAVKEYREELQKVEEKVEEMKEGADKWSM